MYGDGSQRIEAEKARLLKRHLFGDWLVPTIPHRDMAARWAERIRADLPGVIPYGSGAYLIDPEAVAGSWQRTANVDRHARRSVPGTARAATPKSFDAA
ncbi:hypothetical protein [Methylobacterium tardum]|uniref:Uncharacterized protein n=1 Tax=Methylobacterium tardum TaxID=374432 RepID=A0AA37TAR0_9HYPH|nr:hypothetical protein [Methylobacterium tardum]URD38152.1 hypothetical protein M6G65_06720 [Methylobacterium tardum]GLS69936.1 hypothetical protein GCM10007890_19490 [Methylobacterium tardum]